MEDAQIVELYCQRDESAMRECETRYGAYCWRIAMNILHSREDTEECVNDTWLNAFLRDASKDKREIFLMRYWYFMPVHEIASRRRMTVGAVKVALHRMRKDLRAYLEKEGMEV